MSFITDIIGGIAAPIKAIGDVIDQTSTNDEEKLQMKNEADRILNDFFLSVLDKVAAFEAQITERHKNDMQSDSWLSKNVRPLVLIFLTVTTVVLAYTVIFAIDDPARLILIKPWIELLTGLDITVFGFYFGSRGIEKSVKIIADKFGKQITPA